MGAGRQIAVRAMSAAHGEGRLKIGPQAESLPHLVVGGFALDVVDDQD